MKGNLRERLEPAGLLDGRHGAGQFCSGGDGACTDTGLVIRVHRVRAPRRRDRGARPARADIRPSMGKRQRRKQISRKKKGACKLSQSSGRHGHREHHDDQFYKRELSIWPHWSRDLFTHHAA